MSKNACSNKMSSVANFISMTKESVVMSMTETVLDKTSALISSQARACSFSLAPLMINVDLRPA